MAVVDRLLLVAGLSAEGLLCFSTDSPCDAQRCASVWEMHMGSQKGPRTSKPVVIGVSFLISFISFVFMEINIPWALIVGSWTIYMLIRGLFSSPMCWLPLLSTLDTRNARKYV